jgi:lysine-specific demethylase/histidyl-hydroxylase NO66
MAPAVEELVTSYPAWSRVEELPGGDLETKMRLVGDLWEKGILLTREPLEPHYDDP